VVESSFLQRDRFGLTELEWVEKFQECLDDKVYSPGARVEFRLAQIESIKACLEQGVSLQEIAVKMKISS
jgi:hypothetical protein